MRRGATKVFSAIGFPSIWRGLVRTNVASKRTVRFGYGLALVALLLNLTLSLGHVHASHELPSDLQNAASACLIETDCPESDHDEHDCPVCLARAMVATGVIPAAPTVFVPVVANARLLPRQSLFEFRRISASNFDARGPPCGLQA